MEQNTEKKKSIFDIQAEYGSIINEVIEAEGELSPELEASLQLSQEELENKSLAYVLWKKKVESDIDYLSNIKKDADEKIKRLKKKKSFIENALFVAVKNFGKFKAGQFNIGLRNSKSVQVFDEDSIPERYKITTVSIDKKGIAMALRNEEAVEGAVLQENENLSIR